LQRSAKQGKLDSDVEREKGIDLWLRKACIMTRRILLLTAILALFAAPSARADLQITIGNPTVTAQGTGTIDVFLRSTSISPQKLSFFNFEFVIDPPYDVANLLQFLPGQTLDYHTDDPNYVFYNETTGPGGDAFDEDGNSYNGSPPGVEPFIGWVGFDMADANLLGYVDLTPEHDYLLARLTLDHSSIPPPFDPTVEPFTIRLVQGPNTAFFDADFNEIADIATSSFDPFRFTVLPASDPSVIPEPGSLLLFAVVALGAVPYLRRRRLAKG
jgi:hypothetical protein